jgi:pimeloyl-ACP methyl ester carboxylesterase
MAAHPFRAIDAAVRQRVTEQITREMLGPTVISDPNRAEARAAFRVGLFTRMIPAAVPAVRGTIRYPANSRQMLAQIKARTLIIAGEQDYTNGSGVQHAREVHAVITGSRLLTVAAPVIAW